ncbi:MAG TPA: SOS response-associated peptidase [Saprospiraceae bacterium]|nr:SOS response-associated peptidase [Saprospiraceae bacterium]HPG07052.1 SOS response-associated peptidase [Saprospiraceae bacterium]HPQ99415.1 SOS response-associated peptidase [Saprospiraceae bacterium]HRV86534.1 SOS response-associated peptidase [Saprospiraceae bacterium]
MLLNTEYKHPNTEEMCGRSSLTKTEKELEERFHSTFYSEDLERYNPLPNYNVAPTQVMPVITNDDPDHFRPMRWGLIPFWAKDEKIGYKMINARIETLLEKSSFRTAVQKRRCLIPADGFYEWKKNGKAKQPYRIVATNTDLFAFAGIWENWKNPQGEWIQSFTIITQPPNKVVAALHDRMPAILLPEEERLWLDQELKAEDALELIKPYPDEYTKAYPVSPRVNKVGENDAELVEEVSADL